MVVVVISGKTENCTKVSGLMASNMAPVSGEAQKEILISENGAKEKLKGMEYILGSMETDMRANSKTVSNMVKE